MQGFDGAGSCRRAVPRSLGRAWDTGGFLRPVIVCRTGAFDADLASSVRVAVRCWKRRTVESEDNQQHKQQDDDATRAVARSVSSLTVALPAPIEYGVAARVESGGRETLGLSSNKAESGRVGATTAARGEEHRAQ